MRIFMKSMPLIILVVALAVGFFLNKETKKDTNAMIEDTVGSSMAAPQRSNVEATDAAPAHPDLPL
jgi:uncharacterized BrkB/YihY/UPF0761 family membrane protein